MRLRPIIRGLVSYIPILKKILKRKGTGGSNSARYCYSVWMRHLIYLYNSGMKFIPNTIGEIGPGDSLGVGLSAILSGVNEYYALDIIPHAELETNITVLNDLVELFKEKQKIPDSVEFPEIKPLVDNCDFPTFLDSDKIKFELEEQTIKLKMDLENPHTSSLIHYIAPWSNNENIKEGSLDLILSQAVMEHVMELEDAYNKMFIWLRPGGYISHTIDYRAHETHNKWYGHWLYKDLTWKIIMHGRKYPINRLPYSSHIYLIKKAGFEIINEITYFNNTYAPHHKLRIKNLPFTENDLKIESAIIIARKN